MDILLKKQNRKNLLIFIISCIGLLYLIAHLTTNSATTTDATSREPAPTAESQLIRKVKKQKQQLEQETSLLEQHILNKKILPVEYPDAFEFHRPHVNEKFITYLPHSGFHNQRIRECSTAGVLSEPHSAAAKCLSRQSSFSLAQIRQDV